MRLRTRRTGWRGVKIAPFRAGLLRPKAFYFLYYAAIASLLPFLALYYQDLGFSGRQIGVLSGLPPVILMIGAPLWGAIADATNQHRTILILGILSSALTVLGMSFATSFGWLMVAVAVYAFFIAPVLPLADNTVLEVLGSRRELYGRQRMWGAVGWGVSATLVGFFVDRYGLNLIFFVFFFLMTIGIWVSWGFPILKVKIGTDLINGLRALAHNQKWTLLFVIAFLGGMSMAMVTNYIFLYMDSLGASKSLMGLAMTCSTLSELPFLFFSGWMLKRWGPARMIKISFALFALRALAYSLVLAPWMVLPVQLLHGPTFSLIWVAGVALANKIAPEGMGATAQGLFSGAYMGLGSGAGALLGGVLYQALGGAAMFMLLGTAILVGMLCSELAQKMIVLPTFE